MKLEIGCGWHPMPGYDLHVDRVNFPHVEVVADARQLPFADETFAAILSIHCLEHLEYLDLTATLAEWKRVLTRDGVIEVHVPHAENACRAYLHTRDPARRREICRVLLGDANLPPAERGSRHLAMLDPLLMEHFAAQAGLQVVWMGEAEDRHAVWNSLIPGAGLCVLLCRPDRQMAEMPTGCLQGGAS